MKNVLLIGILLIGLRAASATDIPDSKGREFWFAFMPNYHNNYNDLLQGNGPIDEHRLYVYVIADKPTKGTLTARDQNGRDVVVDFDIANAGEIEEISLYFEPYEMKGFNMHGDIDLGSVNVENAVQQAFHIVTDEDVTVYALNQAVMTSEAFLVLPIDALGSDYFVMAYDAHHFDRSFDIPPNAWNIGSAATPSQFVIVATEDNTDVLIQPSCPTFANPTARETSVQLNRGDCYLVQSRIGKADTFDLTGSSIRSSAPVAVFGGQQRTVLPIENSSDLVSRDCLIEQMPPVQAWGKSAYVVPFVMSSSEIRGVNDVYRVLAAYDSTEVFVNAVSVAKLNKGEFYQGSVNAPIHVSSNRPTLVGQYKKTSSPSGPFGVQSRLGDPFLMIIPPAEQFLSFYNFVSVSTKGIDQQGGSVPVEVYMEQYVNVVIDSVNVHSLRLDSAPVSVPFNAIPGTSYVYAGIRVASGSHLITADSTFGIYVYGYGVANSYGYVGGMAYRPLDENPPRISHYPHCDSSFFTATDTLPGDTRVATFTVVDSMSQNIAVGRIEGVTPSRLVRVYYRLGDPRQDGSITVFARDMVGRVSTETVEIAGFTVGSGEPPNQAEIISVNRRISSRRPYCDSLTLTNYGKYPQTLHTIQMLHGLVELEQVDVPLVLLPNDKVTIKYCVRYTGLELVADTLLIGDSCTSVPVLGVIAEVYSDKEAPRHTLIRAKCADTAFVMVTEGESFDDGVESVTILNTINCELSVVTSTTTEYVLQVIINNHYKDAIYSYLSADSAGNSRVVNDTIAGFTLAINEIASQYSQEQKHGIGIGKKACLPVILHNHGLLSLTINRPMIHNNVTFGLIEHQWPVVLQPGEREQVDLCLRSIDTTGLVSDVLTFSDGCVAMSIEYVVRVTPDSLATDSRCGARVMSRYAGRHTIVIAPSPSEEKVQIRWTVVMDHPVVSLYDLQGYRAYKTVVPQTSVVETELDVSEFPAGRYVVVVEDANNAMYGVMTIAR